jgi:hypothetical protein
MPKSINEDLKKDKIEWKLQINKENLTHNDDEYKKRFDTILSHYRIDFWLTVEQKWIIHRKNK